jgi:hypothetical protein
MNKVKNEYLHNIDSYYTMLEGIITENYAQKIVKKQKTIKTDKDFEYLLFLLF